MAAALAADVAIALLTSSPAGAALPSATTEPSSVGAVAALKARAVATLKILKDGVAVQRKGKTVFKPALDGQKLRVGDTIQTDTSGLAEIDYTASADSFTRLDVSTTFTIKHLTDNQGHRQVEGSLDSGRTWNRTSALTESESFSQDAAGATASVIGSAFMVECDTTGHCTFTSVVDGLKLVTVDGEVKLLTPLEQCDSTEVDPSNATLCGVPTQVTADVLAANLWILQNLFFDGKAGFPGPTIAGTIVVTNGVVTFTPTPPANNSENPPATQPAVIDPANPVLVSGCAEAYPAGVCSDIFDNTKANVGGAPGFAAQGLFSLYGSPVDFTINASDPNSPALPFFVVFDALPDSGFGFLTYDDGVVGGGFVHAGDTSNAGTVIHAATTVNVLTGTQYDPTTLFTFHAVVHSDEVNPGPFTDTNTSVHVEHADGADPSASSTIPIVVDCSFCC